MRKYRLTEERKAVFLKALAVTGSPTAAAAEATPWSKHRHGGVATFRDEARRDPEFAASWERAMQAALAAVEREIVRRAMEPPKRPIWENGVLKGWVEDRASSDKLLLRVAAKLDPAWRERTTLDANVSVHAEVLTVTPQDVLLLAYDDQEALLALMEKIALVREERGIEVEVPRLPATGTSA
jgi:hypothetical protein